MEHAPKTTNEVHQGNIFTEQKPATIDEFVKSKYFSTEEKIAYLAEKLAISPSAIEIRDGIAYHTGTEQPILEYVEMINNLYDEKDNTELFHPHK